MTKNRWLLTAAIAVIAVPASSQTNPTFDAARLTQHIQTLSSDAFEGRGPGTAGEKKTIDYLVREFEAAGLRPGGELVNGQRQWTQRVPLLKSDIVGSPSVTVRTPAGPVQLAQGEQISVRAPTNGQAGVALAGAPLVFAGYGVSAQERNWDDFKGQDLKGKVLVVLINDPDFEGGDGDFGGKAMTYYGRWTYKYEEAARRGAAGVMIVHETAPASYGWATVKNSNTNTMFDIVRANPAAVHPPFESWITRETAVQLFRNAGLDFEVARQSARRRDFRPVDLRSTLDASVQAKTETITSFNVAGILPGKSRPDETIIYSGHYDHLGVGAPDANGDRIYNGAVDNSTGLAHMIEQARAFARAPRTERSIIFLALAAEEKGLLGSDYYAANPLYPLGKTVGVINTDSMGTWGPSRDFSISGSARLGLLDTLIEEGRRRGRTFVPDSNPQAGLFYRSDHFPFAKAGVPAISFKPGLDLVKGGTARGQAMASEYTEKRYHQPDDEYSPSWDLSGISDDAALLHAVGQRLGNSAEWPNWSQDSEFRGIRDRSQGARSAAPPPPRTGVVPTAPAPDVAGERG